MLYALGIMKIEDIVNDDRNINEELKSPTTFIRQGLRIATNCKICDKSSESKDETKIAQKVSTTELLEEIKDKEEKNKKKKKAIKYKIRNKSFI